MSIVVDWTSTAWSILQGRKIINVLCFGCRIILFMVSQPWRRRSVCLGPVHTETFSCVFVLFTVLKGIENNQLLLETIQKRWKTFPCVRGLKVPNCMAVPSDRLIPMHYCFRNIATNIYFCRDSRRCVRNSYYFYLGSLHTELLTHCAQWIHHGIEL